MRQVKDYGPESVEIMAAALGQAPYARGNQFLEGFIRWQAAGNQSDWGNYLFQCFRERQPNEDHIRAKLEEIGIEVIDFDMWPGFSDLDYREAGEYAAAIVRLREKPSASFLLPDEELEQSRMTNLDGGKDPYKKSLPEAEAFIITKNEREGQYHMLSEPDALSDAWFISNTSILNLLEKNSNPVTWQPDAFLKFSNTLSKPTEEASSDKAFQTILWSCAQSGLSLLDEDTVATVLGEAIDQATVSLVQERQRYTETIGVKYGEPIEAVLSRLSPVNRPLAAIQLANEMAQASDKQRHRAEEQATRATEVARSALKKASDIEKKLAEVEEFKRKMDAKKAQSKRNKRKQKANKPKNKRRR